MTGVARTLLSQGKPAEALKAHAADGERSKICFILENPGILAEQTPDWATRATQFVASAQQEWLEAVIARAKKLPEELQTVVAAATKLPKKEFEHLCLQYSGKAGLIYLNVCPLCETKNVIAVRVDPSTFQAPSRLKHVLSHTPLHTFTPCTHALPLPDALWQVMHNANYIVGKNIPLTL